MPVSNATPSDATATKVRVRASVTTVPAYLPPDLDNAGRRLPDDVDGFLRGAGTTLLVSSHVMDEAERCERLLLMREGGMLADESPAALLERTGAADVESAFLSIVDQAGAAA